MTTLCHPAIMLLNYYRSLTEMHSMSVTRRHAQLVMVRQLTSKSEILNGIFTLGHFNSRRQNMYMLTYLSDVPEHLNLLSSIVGGLHSEYFSVWAMLLAYLDMQLFPYCIMSIFKIIQCQNRAPVCQMVKGFISIYTKATFCICPIH